MSLPKFWKSLTGRSQGRADRGELPIALCTALEDLDRLTAARAELEAAGRTLARVLLAAFGAPLSEPTPTLSERDPETSFLIDRIREGWREGVPAIRVVRPSLDRVRLADRGTRICRELEGENPAAGALLTAIETGPDRMAEWADMVLYQNEDRFRASIHELGIEYPLADSVLRLALLAELGTWSGQLAAHLLTARWNVGCCPVCGAWPGLAESRGLEQRRFLRCDRCAGDWPGDRLRCPFCAETDHRALHYRFVEGEQDRYRLALCDRCGGRIEVISTIASLSAPGLNVAKLSLCHLGIIGQEWEALPNNPSSFTSCEDA